MSNENRFSFWILLGILEIGAGTLMSCISFVNKELWSGVSFLCNAIMGLAICQLGFNKIDIQDQSFELTKATKKIKTLEEKINGLENIINQNNQIVVPETKKEKAPELGEEIKFEPPSKNIFMKR